MSTHVFFKNNDLTEIMRFIRFDKKSEKSQHLQINKFDMIYNMDLLRIHKIIINLVHILLLMSSCFHRRLDVDLSGIYRTNRTNLT